LPKRINKALNTQCTKDCKNRKKNKRKQFYGEFLEGSLPYLFKASRASVELTSIVASFSFNWTICN